MKYQDKGEFVDEISRPEGSTSNPQDIDERIRYGARSPVSAQHSPVPLPHHQRRRLYEPNRVPERFVSISYTPTSSLQKCSEEALDVPAVGVAFCFGSLLLLNRTPLRAYSRNASALSSCSSPQIPAIPCWVSGEYWDSSTSKARLFGRSCRGDGLP